MSKWIDRAEQIRARLATVAELQGVDCIIDRQGDILSQVRQAIAKSKGAAITILWVGGQPDPDTASPIVSSGEYLIRIYSKSILRTGECPVDDLVEAAVAALQNYNPGTRHCHEEFRIAGRVELAADKHYLIYEFTLETRVSLNIPTINTPPES